MYFNMENKIKKKKLDYLIITFVATLVISQLISAITGYTIVDPLLDRWGPKNLEIDPVNFPITKEGKNFIHINLKNSGIGKIDNLNAEYNLKCQNDRNKKAELHKSSLSKGEEDFFEFEADLNTNCSIGTTPSTIKFYSDIKGNCYAKFEEKISNICQYCELDIMVYDGFKKIQNLTYWYPFSEGNFSVGGEVTSGCLLYESVENKSQLKYLPDRDIKMTFYAVSIGCIRGDIEKEWCIENVPELYR